jgi:DNA adenine methylase
MKTKPFLRWAGGKTQLLSQLLEHVPDQYGTYHEPFLGGGALFFTLRPRFAELGDMNVRLVNAYDCLARRLQQTVKHLMTLERSSECFYKQRDLLNAERPHPQICDPEAAARFIYLNKTCFNGLWRENAAGNFNTPYGGNRKSQIVDPETLLACSVALSSCVNIRNESFEAVNERAKEGDLVYFDPPYMPINKNSFIDYVSGGFDMAQHTKLRDLARSLKERGCHVILSNSDTPQVRSLYDGFQLQAVDARRSINSDGDGRGKVGELIIT